MKRLDPELDENPFLGEASCFHSDRCNFLSCVVDNLLCLFLFPEKFSEIQELPAHF